MKPGGFKNIFYLDHHFAILLEVAIIFHNKIILSAIIFIAGFSSNGAFAEYLEGIDTTDADGYGLDSMFYIEKNWIFETEKTLRFICYCQEHETGYFRYSFDDLIIVPATIKPDQRYEISGIYSPLDYCYIVQNKDSIYSKIKVIGESQDNRFIFRWGTNTTPNNRMLIADDYDRSILYKPNNLHMWFTYDGKANDTISWEPPLDNDNHLLGYIFYIARVGSIDTTVPIELNQWSSTFIGDSIEKVPCGDYARTYYNMVAVYREGNSDLLEGWSGNINPIVNIATISNRKDKSSFQIKSINGLFVSEPVNTNFSVSTSSAAGYGIFLIIASKWVLQVDSTF